MDSNSKAIDWKAFETWADAHKVPLAIYKKLPRKQLELANALANYQADRAVGLFLNSLKDFKEAVALLPAAEARGKYTALLAEAFVRYKELRTISENRRKGGASKRGKFGPLRRLVDRLRPNSFSDLLSKLRDGDEIADIKYSLHDPIDFELLEFDEDGEKIEYRTAKGHKVATFKTLRSYIPTGRLK